MRPRFKRNISQASEVVLNRLEANKGTQSDFMVSRIDTHVFIRIPKRKEHFWSPQLHIEVNEIDEQHCELRVLFSPSPTVWTFFMFLHFLVTCLFIGFRIWVYTNATLKNAYGIQLGLIFFWCSFGLYSTSAVAWEKPQENPKWLRWMIFWIGLLGFKCHYEEFRRSNLFVVKREWDCFTIVRKDES